MATRETQQPIDVEKLQEDATALVREAATIRTNLVKRLDQLIRKLAAEIGTDTAGSTDDAVLAKIRDLDAAFSVMRELTQARRGAPRGPRLPPGTIGWIMIGGEPVPIPRGGGLICNSKGVCNSRDHETTLGRLTGHALVLESSRR